MANPDLVQSPATATAATITQQLGVVRAALQQIIANYTTVQLTRPERQRLNKTSSESGPS